MLVFDGCDAGKNSQSIERDLTSNVSREHRRLRWMYLCWSGVVATFAVRTALYVKVFLSEKEVFYNGYLTCPKSAKVLNNYALHMLNAQHAGEVVDLLDQAIDIYPAYSNGHYNKGLAHHLLASILGWLFLLVSFHVPPSFSECSLK